MPDIGAVWVERELRNVVLAHKGPIFNIQSRRSVEMWTHWRKISRCTMNDDSVFNWEECSFCSCWDAFPLSFIRQAHHQVSVSWAACQFLDGETFAWTLAAPPTVLSGTESVRVTHTESCYLILSTSIVWAEGWAWLEEKSGYQRWSD